MEQKPARFVGGPLDGRTIEVEFPFREELRMMTGVRPTATGTSAARHPFQYACYRLAEGDYHYVPPKGRPGDGTTWPRRKDGGEPAG